jgi:hypothetical protein
VALVWRYRTFPHYLKSGKIFRGVGGGITEHKMYVLIFCTTLCETSVTARRMQRNAINVLPVVKCTAGCCYGQSAGTATVMVRVCVLQLLWSHSVCTATRLVSARVGGKHSYTKFHENPFSRSRVVPCRQTDIHEADSRFSQFHEISENELHLPTGKQR